MSIINPAHVHVSLVNAVRGKYLASYAPADDCGPAEFSYGASEADALANLAAKMQCNFDDRGSLV